MDMTLATLLGGKPSSRQRPDLAALYDWFVDSSPSDAEAAVFVNVPEHLVERLTGWVIWLNQTGFRVFAKPKVGDSDIDDELAGYAFAHGADEVFLASHDARAFADRAEATAKAGVEVIVLGFRELSGRLAQSSDTCFVDLADIPGLFAELPPRLSLASLPPEGRWFEPITETDPVL